MTDAYAIPRMGYLAASPHVTRRREKSAATTPLAAARGRHATAMEAAYRATRLGLHSARCGWECSMLQWRHVLRFGPDMRRRHGAMPNSLQYVNLSEQPDMLPRFNQRLL